MQTKRKIFIILGSIFSLIFFTYSFIFIIDKFFPKKELPTTKEAGVIAENWIKNFSVSFPYYGRELKMKNGKEEERGFYSFVFSFETYDDYYGLQDKEMVIKIEGLEVVSAVTNGIFDEIKNKYIEQEKTIDLYFAEKTINDEEEITIKPVKRVVFFSIKDNQERMSVVELLSGLTEEEKKAGLSTFIEEGTELLSFKIENKVAYLEFSKDISEKGGDQIKKTISQFGTVEDVKTPIKKDLIIVNVDGVPNNFLFRKDLKEGDSDLDVRYLQIILNADPETKVSEGGPGSPGEEINSFGPATTKAVMNFQRKYADEVLSPGGFILSTGRVDINMRDKLNTILDENRLRSTKN